MLRGLSRIETFDTDPTNLPVVFESQESEKVAENALHFIVVTPRDESKAAEAGHVTFSESPVDVPDGNSESRSYSKDNSESRTYSKDNSESRTSSKDKDFEEDHTASSTLDPVREKAKAALAILICLILWLIVFIGPSIGPAADYEKAACHLMPLVEKSELRSCDVCGEGTLFLPMFGEYENSLDKGARTPLYLLGIIVIFMGMGIVCDMFMDAIEEITNSEYLVWKQVHQGGRQKFHLKIWNPTMANLTLMALGSSAPEILLSATELMGNKYFAGSLGPSTIVGSAAFNLFVISAVCVAAIPAPETRTIQRTGVFMVTSVISLLAYVWILIVLLGISPEKVDTWEAVATILLLPLFLALAFAADRQIGPFRYMGSDSKNEESEKEARHRMVMQYGNLELPQDVVKAFLRQGSAEKHSVASSRAKLRRLFTGAMTGGLRRQRSDGSTIANQMHSRKHDCVVEFEHPTYAVMECAGHLHVKVNALPAPEHLIQVHYCTREGSAKQDLRYRHVEGFLSFAPGVTQKSIEIPIIDDDLWGPDEEFYIELSDLTMVGSRAANFMRPAKTSHSIATTMTVQTTGSSAGSGDKHRQRASLGTSLATIVVLNDDEPGTLAFDADEVFTVEGATVQLGIMRTNGHAGAIQCFYETIDDSAVGGADYESKSSFIEFADGETHKNIEIAILVSSHHRYESDERFKVRLKDASPGVRFDKHTDGGETSAVCDVVIGSSGSAAPHVRCAGKWCNRDRLQRGMEIWQRQIIESMYCGGSIEEQAEAGLVDWALHVTSLIFKFMFIAVPPSMLGGGWPRFIISLGMIGFVTALAGDIASLLGCCVGIPDDVTAITLVALGTSLPDTLASKAAAQQDDCADNAIGNITGSNSVNVFMGLGLSWTIGSFYWEQSTLASKEWEEHTIDGRSFKDRYGDEHPTGGFFVPASTLAFSVSVYLVCALICLSFLRYRHHRYGGELGGPRTAQFIGSFFLFSLWVIYIAAVCIYASSQ